MSEREKREAFVTLATNDTYSLGCLVLGSSLRRAGTTRQLVVMVTTGVSNPMRSQLAQVFDLIQEVNLLDSKDPVNLSLLGRPDLNVTFTKLHCWRLTQFDKAVFLDADTLVLQNVDDLMDREELSAAPDAGWPDCFNSGVFVYKPSLDTYQSLLSFATSQGSFDGGDQGLLNMYFKDWSTKDIARHLPFTYNVVSQAFYSYLPAFTQFKDKVKIVHFIGAVKPWHHTYNTSTKQVTPLPGTGHSQEYLQVWWSIFMDRVQPSLDPALRRKCPLLPTIVVSHPCSKQIYAYIPQSKYPVIKLENVAPWSWSRSFWCSPINSSVFCCKMAFRAFSRCWQNDFKTKQEELTRTLIPLELRSHTNPDNLEAARSKEHRESTVHTIYPFKLPDVEEVFYNVSESKNETSGDKNEEPKIVDMTLISRSYTNLESNYAEEPLSSMDPDSPPSTVYEVSKVMEGWEKSKTPVESDKTFVESCEHSKSSTTSDKTVAKSVEHETKDSEKVMLEKLTSTTSETEVGLVGELASLTIQGAEGGGDERQLSEQERKFNWEKGQIDYLGQDSFDNIQKKIESSLSSEATATAPSTTSPVTTATEPIAPVIKPSTTSNVTAAKVTTAPATKPSEPQKTVSTGLKITLGSKKK